MTSSLPVKPVVGALALVLAVAAPWLLSSYDLPLPDAVQPHNQDGEVAAFLRLPVAEALALAASDRMTVDAALVTLDFALRHRLLPGDEHQRLAARMQAYWLDD